jgi:NAD(P)-dependent dehydrogenase (short-subunit alcohol dehydrogenase family)
MAAKKGMLEGWAIVLGASSGFGAACALELARNGLNIFGVHLDLRGTLPNALKVKADIEATGRKVVFFNQDASNVDKMNVALDKMQEIMRSEGGSDQVRVLLHSLAFGTLKPFIAAKPEDAISPANMDMTLNVMAHCLVYWVQALVQRNMLRDGSRVFAMTSAGSHRVFPNYGAVSAAKAALESHCRQLALELGMKGIAVNALMAGLTVTPALRKIPGNELLEEEALKRNPTGRLTTPQDVAGALIALCHPQAGRISGATIAVDGGEDIV